MAVNDDVEPVDYRPPASPVAVLPKRLQHLPSTWTLFGLGLTVAFVALTIGPALLGHGVLIDVGRLSRYMPWRAAGVAADATTNYCRGDTVDSAMPQIAAIRHGILRGDFWTWMPFPVGGAPLAALPNAGVFDPVSWPYLVMPLWLAPAFARLLQVLVAVVGMVAFLRRHGVRPGTGIIAGIAYASSGFLVMWSGWPQTAVACWIPALFWALDRATCERRVRDVVVLGAVFAAMLLGGFPAVTMYAMTAAAVYVLARALSAARIGGWPRLVTGGFCVAAGIFLGAGLAAFQLLPFTKDVGTILAHRVPGGALPVGQFLTTFAPDVHGLCGDGFYTGPVIPIEGVSYLGVAAATLAILGVAWALLRGSASGPVRLLAAMIVVVAMLLWVGGPVLQGIQRLPGYDTNAFSRAIVIFCFLGAVLSGFGLEALARRGASRGNGQSSFAADSTSRQRIAHAAAVVLAVAFVTATIAFLLWSLRASHADAEATDSVAVFKRGLRGPAIVLGLTALALVAALQSRVRRLQVVAPIVLALLVVGQGVVFARAASPINAKRFFYPQTAAHTFLQRNIGEDRYGGGFGWGSNATPTYYGLRSPVGHAFTTQPWAELLIAMDPRIRVTQTYSEFPASISATDVGRLPLLDQLSVKYWATYPTDLAGRQTRNRLAGEHTTPMVLRPQQVGTCTLPAGPLRGIAVTFPDGVAVSEGGSTAMHVRVSSSDGTVVGEQVIDTAIKPGTAYRVGLAGEDLRPGGKATAQVWFSSTATSTRLAATTTGLACAPVRPVPNDGLRLVFADAGALIYERKTTLPRIRWAGRSVVATDPRRRIAMMKEGVPDGLVILSDGRSPAAKGSQAAVHVTHDGNEQMAVTVDASGAGYLVVADAIARPGWHATVDGRPAPIVQADHAFAGVAVPAGVHRLEIGYTAPGLRAGTTISLGSATGAALLVGGATLIRRRRRQRPPDDTGDDD